MKKTILSTQNMIRCLLVDNCWRFTAEVKHLDLEYDGQFDTFMYYSEIPLSLAEQITGIGDAVFNQLEVDNCICTDTIDDIFERIMADMYIEKEKANSQTAVFFNYKNGAEGQYYIILKGEKCNYDL